MASSNISKAEIEELLKRQLQTMQNMLQTALANQANQRTEIVTEITCLPDDSDEVESKA